MAPGCTSRTFQWNFSNQFPFSVTMSRSRSKEDSQSEFVVEPRVSRSRAVAKVTETAAEDSSTRRRGRTEIKSAIVETQRVTHSSDESAESSSDEDVEMFDASSDLPEFPEVIEPPRTPRRNQAVDVAAALNGLQQRRVVTSAPAPTVLSEMSRGASQGPSSPVVEKSSSTSPIVWIVLLVAAAAVAMWFAPFAQSMLSPTMMAQTPPNIVATPSTPQNIIISSSDAVPNPAGHQSTSESTAASVSASPDQQASKVTETTSTVSPTAPPSVPTQTPSPSPPPISPVQSAIAQLATRHPWFAHSLLSNDSPTSLRFVLEEQLRRISAAMAADADGPRSRAPSDEADSWPRPLVLTIAAPAGARETHAFGEELSRMLASLLQPHRVATPQQAPPRPRMFTLKPGSTSYINANVLRQTILKELNDGKLPGVATSGPPMPSTMWLQASLNSPGFPFSAAHALWSITDEQRPVLSLLPSLISFLFAL
jgi:hypothetical protein